MRDIKPKRKTKSATTLRQRAEEIAQASPADISEITAEEMHRLVYELQVQKIELELQNEQLRAAELELAMSRDRLSDLYEFAPVGYVTLDRTGLVIEANLTVASLLGIERSSLLQLKFSRFIAPDCQDAAHLYWRKVFSTAGRQVVELDLQRSDGAAVTVRLESIAFDNPPEPERQCRVALIDIRDLKRARDLLSELNTNLEQRVDGQVTEISLMAKAIANLSEGVLITTDPRDKIGARIVFVNEAMCRVVGYTAEEMLGQSPKRLLGGFIDSAALQQLIAQLVAAKSFRGELAYRRKDGECGEVELFISPLLDAATQSVHFVAVERDITERKRAERVLWDREARLQAILDAALDAIITIDRKGIVQDFNARAEQMFGYGAGEIVGQNIGLLMPSPYSEAHDGYLQRYRETGKTYVIGARRELTALHRDGHSFPISLSVSEVDHLGLYTGVIHDTSQLHKLRREVLHDIGEVQWRIGQALHDGPQQALAGLSLLARGLALDLGRDSNLTVVANRLSEGVREANHTIRSLARGLIPVRIGSGSLMAALEGLADQISTEHDLVCDFECLEPIEIEDDYTVEQLYFVAQEATLNAVKHAGASRIRISLGRQGREISLRVVDDGVGIDRANVRNQGLGLQIMPYRASTIGASVTVSGGAGGGTVVDCRLPNWEG